MSEEQPIFNNSILDTSLNQPSSNLLEPFQEELGLSLITDSGTGSGSALPGYLLESIDLAHKEFSHFIASPNLDSKINLVFDNNWDRQIFQDIVKDVEQNGFRNLVEIDV